MEAPSGKANSVNFTQITITHKQDNSHILDKSNNRLYGKVLNKYPFILRKKTNLS